MIVQENHLVARKNSIDYLRAHPEFAEFVHESEALPHVSYEHYLSIKGQVSIWPLGMN
jgi:hypothetical protein